ncbi:restriction endonuclease subunit S [Aeromonas hydrophila]
MSSEDKPLLLPLFVPQVDTTWEWARLDSVAEVFDCPHSTPALVEELAAPLVIRSQDVRTGVITTATVARVSEATYQERVKRVVPHFGDLVYSREGTYFGIAAEVPKGVKLCLGQRMVLIRPNPKLIHHRYLRYWLNSPQVFSHIHGFRDGTVAERLNLPVIRGLAIGFPPLEMQESIAKTLAAFDDRITLLRETNATLEAIAQALFKSWFVDFDPVHACARGEQPAGLAPEVATLFPDSFEESELGMIPKGWKLGTIGDFAEQKKGSVNPLLQPETLFEHFSLPAFDNQQTPVLELGTEIKSNKTPLPKEAVLLSKLNPHIPRLWLPIEYGGAAVCSTEFLAYSPKGASSKEFIYCAFSSEQFIQHLCQLVTGTSNSHQRVKPDQVLLVAAVLPSDEVFKQFELIANPLFAKVHENRKQAQTLATLRDTLLPRLISGQLRLPEAEEQLSEAGLCQ